MPSLKDLKNRIANKKKIKTKTLGEGWYQFFPEDLAAQAQVASRVQVAPQALVLLALLVLLCYTHRV